MLLLLLLLLLWMIVLTQVLDFLMLSYEIVEPLLKPALFLTTVLVCSFTLSLVTGWGFMTCFVIVVVMTVLILWYTAPYVLDRLWNTSVDGVVTFFKSNCGGFSSSASASTANGPAVIKPFVVPSGPLSEAVEAERRANLKAAAHSSAAKAAVPMTDAERLDRDAMLMRTGYGFAFAYGERSFDPSQQQMQNQRPLQLVQVQQPVHLSQQAFIPSDEGTASLMSGGSSSQWLSSNGPADTPFFEYQTSVVLPSEMKNKTTSNSVQAASNSFSYLEFADDFVRELRLAKDQLPTYRKRFRVWMHDSVIVPLVNAMKQSRLNEPCYAAYFQASDLPPNVVMQRVTDWNDQRVLQSYDWNGERLGSMNADALILAHLLRTAFRNAVPGTVLSWSHDGTTVELFEREHNPPHYEVRVDGVEHAVRPGSDNFATAVVLFMRAAQLHNDMSSFGIPEMNKLQAQLQFDNPKSFGMSSMTF